MSLLSLPPAVHRDAALHARQPSTCGERSERGLALLALAAVLAIAAVAGVLAWAG
jgi:hypothetical protein